MRLKTIKKLVESTSWEDRNLGLVYLLEYIISNGFRDLEPKKIDSEDEVLHLEFAKPIGPDTGYWSAIVDEKHNICLNCSSKGVVYGEKVRISKLKVYSRVEVIYI